MPKLRVHNFSVSLGGFGAGPDQGPNNPLGVTGCVCASGILATPTFAQAYGGSETDSAGSTDVGGNGLDDQVVAGAEVGIGATMMAEHVRARPWPVAESEVRVIDQWTGWWGDEPPFRHPVSC